MAAMNYFYGIKKRILAEKIFGIFPHLIIQPHPLLNGLSQGFITPHARYAEMDKEQIMQDPRLVINSVDDNGHLFMVSSKEKPEQNFIFSHIEYGRNGLRDEYRREIAAHPDRHYKKPENYEARATMWWAASWSLNSFCTSGFQTQPSLHTLEQFSATYDMTHGLALAIIMPQWMKYLLDRDETVIDDFARFGVNVMGIEASDNKKIDAYQTIKALQSFIQDELGLPMFLSQLKIDDTKFQCLLFEE